MKTNFVFAKTKTDYKPGDLVKVNILSPIYTKVENRIGIVVQKYKYLGLKGFPNLSFPIESEWKERIPLSGCVAVYWKDLNLYTEVPYGHLVYIGSKEYKIV